jgi:hypothetical protein
MTDLNINKNELVDILINRADNLKKVIFAHPIETENAIKAVQAVLDEYKARFEDYRKVKKE